jgi:hypothetical protein
MKNFLMLFLCASIFWACNDVQTNKQDAVIPAETSHQYDENKSTLKLNNGAKWKADEGTNKNVAELNLIADRFTEGKNKSVTDYVAFANELQNSLDKTIKECRMQGPDHEALHQWLQPLLEHVNRLKTVKTESEASKIFAEINDEVSVYHQYFE